MNGRINYCPISFFFSIGVKPMTLVYDEKGILTCPNCNSRTFDLIAEMRVSDVSPDEDNPKDEPVGNRTVESERIVSLVCARCGAQLK